MLEEAAAAGHAQAAGGHAADRAGASRGPGKASSGGSPETRGPAETGSSPAAAAAADRGEAAAAAVEWDGGGGGGRRISADRMQGQIERLTDALVRCSGVHLHVRVGDQHPAPCKPMRLIDTSTGEMGRRAFACASRRVSMEAYVRLAWLACVLRVRKLRVG
jgi:hypothetical protein